MQQTDRLKNLFRIPLVQEKALEKLGLESVSDLLYYFPRSYGDTAAVTPIERLEAGENAVIFGTLSGLKTKKSFKSKVPMAEGAVKDATGSVKVIWFHQAYLAKMLTEGTFVRVEGKVSERNGSFAFSNPKIESVPDLFTQSAGHSLFPVYPETRGVTSNWLYHKLQAIFSSGLIHELADPIPAEILKRYSLPSLKTALVWIHTPKSTSDAEMARKRFAFEEIFFIQLEKEASRHTAREKAAFVIEKSAADVAKFVSRFPFQATEAQNRAVSGILADFTKGYPMSRLLEGDVGSGKTAVAATAAYAVATTRPKDQKFGTLQVAYMAPTEILARQHFESFIKYFSHLPINIALITGNACLKFPSKIHPDGATDISKSQLLKWVASGEISVVVGTHALIQKNVKFKHLALAVVDEQHRFGIAQRQKLVTNHATIPHLLSMTATPIPRTLALTLYGDLDLTLLDQMPAGRKPVVTKIVPPQGRSAAYTEIEKELKAGRQAYVICPRIAEPDPTKEQAVQAKSVKAEAARLKKDVFPHYRVEILHSKMKPAEKDAIMAKFNAHEIDILVSTSVVEVGVSVANATVIIIEGAERFGLAQLHQLRGRVLRGTHQPYCYLFPGSESQKSAERLKALTEAKNGFELAELDLKNRGAGALTGVKQWGISDLGMEAIKNLKMVEAARAEARRLVEEDASFETYLLIKERLEAQERKIHFE